MGDVARDTREQTTERPVNPRCFKPDMPGERTNTQAIALYPQIGTIRNVVQVNQHGGLR